MKNNKKFLVLTAFILLLTTLGGNSVSALEQGKEVVSKENDVRIKKTAHPLENRFNEWRIDLEVEVQPSIIEQDIVLVLDTSGSMKNNDRIGAIKKAATALVENALASELNKNKTRIAIVDYSSTADVLVPLSNDLENIKSAISTLKAQGNTASHSALYLAENILSGSNSERKTIVFMTDGQPTISYDLSDIVKSKLTDNDFIIIEKTADYSDLEINFDSENVKNIINDHYHEFFDYSTSIAEQYMSLRSYPLGIFESNQAIYENKYINFNESLIIESSKIKEKGIDLYTIGVGVDENAAQALSKMSTDNKYFDIQDSGIDKLTELYESIATELMLPYSSFKITDPIGEGFEVFDNTTREGKDERILYPTITTANFEFKPSTESFYYKYSYYIRTIEDVLSLIDEQTKPLPANGKTTFNYDNHSLDFIVPNITPTLLKVEQEYYDKNNQEIEPIASDLIGDYLIKYNGSDLKFSKKDNVVYLIPYEQVANFDVINDLSLEEFNAPKYTFNGKIINNFDFELTGEFLNKLKLERNQKEEKPTTPVDPVDPVVPIKPIDPAFPKPVLPNTGIESNSLKVGTLLIALGTIILYNKKK